MTRLDLSADLACSAGQAWCLLTDPAQLNAWSTALTRVADTGGDDRFDRPGTLREVRLAVPLRRRVHQVVTVADEPRRLDFRVYRGAPLLRDHNVRIDIDEIPAGCTVRLTVDVSFASKLGVIATPSLRREMEKSLIGLAEQSRRMPPSTRLDARRPVVAAPPTDGSELLLRREVDRQIGHQRLMADEMARTGDPKYWFARGNVLANQEMLALIDARVLEHPDWLLRLMSSLHRRFVSNLHAFRTGGPMSPVWREAWERCEESSRRRPARRVIVGAVAGSHAMTAEDVPRALADVYDTYYRDTHHYKEFRPDYIRLADVYGTAVDRLIAEMPADLPSLGMRLSTKLSPELRDLFIQKVYFDIEAHRLQAFEDGYDLTRRDT